MSVNTKEKRLESDIESFLCSSKGGYLKTTDKESLLYVDGENWQVVDGGYKTLPGRGLDITTLVSFIQSSQPKSWERFERMCNSDSSL